jgi:peptide/nickel transport system ATP-binding protein
MSDSILDIQNLSLSFQGLTETVDVLDNINLSISRGERVALVGESGSGKSVIARIILGLLQSQKGAIVKGSVRFRGIELEAATGNQIESLRGREISMIFQDPTSSMNPVYKIGTIFHEILNRGTHNISKKLALIKASKLLEEVSITEFKRVLESYPFQLSGGMNQRVMIALALANKPALLIADEPGTALDVTVQAQTLKLMHNLVKKNNTAVLFISHNLSVVRQFADRVYVIYKGRIVESGSTSSIFENTKHPYTKALMNAVPKITSKSFSDASDDSSLFKQSAFHHKDREIGQ